MTDIRDRVRTVEQSDRVCTANKAIAYRPEIGDDESIAGLLVRTAMSADVSGIEIDDVDNVDALSEKADDMVKMIVSGGGYTGESMVLDGVHLKATKKEIIISIPGSEIDLDAEEILLTAERRLSEYTEGYEI